MIPYTTCMCFSSGGPQRPFDRRWNVLTGVPSQHRGRVIVEKTDTGGVYIRLLGQEEEEKDDDREGDEGEGDREDGKEDSYPQAASSPQRTSFSQSEHLLLQALDVATRGSEGRHTHQRSSTCFYTLQRQRFHRPVLRPESLSSPIIDTAYSGLIQCIMGNVGKWAFNSFNLDVATGGRPLSVLLAHLFHAYGFLSTFRLDAVKMWRCFSLIEIGYHHSNPYHNSVHAADVTQAMHCFISEKKIGEMLTPVEAMAAILAAVTHDLDHPGVNQPFLIATSNHLAALYKNFSVLENHHWRCAVSCLRESGIFDHLDRHIWEEVERQIRSMILATDITRQQEFISKFKVYLENNSLKLEEPEHRHFVLQIALKCADLGNPCRPWPISRRWSLLVCQEFYRQGEMERRLNLPVTPMCDRGRMTIAKIQADFFKYVVTPLFEVWDCFLDSPLSKQLLHNLTYNNLQWQNEINRALADTPQQAQEDAAQQQEEGEACATSDEASAADVWYSSAGYHSMRAYDGRRRSVPLTTSEATQPRVQHPRRKSFPQAPWKPALEFPLHRSPHMSLRTLSAEHILPAARTNPWIEKHPLVHQPVSYPPYATRGATHVGEQEEEIPTLAEETEPSEPADRVCTDGCCGTPPEGTPSRRQSEQEEERQRSNAACQQMALFLNALVEGAAKAPLVRLKSDSDVYLNPAKMVLGAKDVSAPVAPPTSSWCSRVRHSLSEERPSVLSCDSKPAASSRLVARRGSAPVVMVRSAGGDVVRNRGGLKGGGVAHAFGRRWSIPTEAEGRSTVSSFQGSCAFDAFAKSSGPPPGGGHFAPGQKGLSLSRRHSFGLLEPFLVNASSECIVDEGAVPPACDPIPTFQQFSTGRRRGSLPVDILMRRTSAPRTTSGQVMFSRDCSAFRRRSAGDVLGVLVGPIGLKSALVAGDGFDPQRRDSATNKLDILGSFVRAVRTGAEGGEPLMPRFKVSPLETSLFGAVRPSGCGVVSPSSLVVSSGKWFLTCQQGRGSLEAVLSSPAAGGAAEDK